MNITAWNPVSSQTVATTIYVGEAPSGTTVIDPDPVTKPGEPKKLSLSFAQIASDVCVYVCWGDGTKELYSNATSCSCKPDSGLDSDYTKVSCELSI